MPRLIGVDIGSRYTKVVQIEPKAKPRLINAFLFPTPYLKTTQVSSIKQIDAEEFFNQIVSRIPMKNLQASYIGINLPSFSTTVLVIKLPRMSKRELDTAAIAEAKRKMIPPSHENHIFEYSILREVIIAKIPRYEVLVMRTEKFYIQEILRIFTVFREIQPSLISPTCYTILNLLSSRPEFREQNSAFIDIGYESIDISIAQKGKLFFYRNINYGFKDIISHISASTGLGPEKTEEILRQKGIPQVPFDIKDKVAVAEEIMRQKYKLSSQGKDSQQEVNLLELRMLWQLAIERITNEIRRSFIYYKEQSEGGRIGLIFFLGGVCQIDGFISTLANNIGGQCEILNPLKEMDIALEKSQFEDVVREGSLFAPAAAGALSTQLTTKKHAVINFLPLELRIKEQIAIRRLAITTLGICLVLFFSLAWINFFINNKIFNTDLRAIEFRLKKLEPAIQTSNELKQRIDKVNQESAQIEQMLKKRIELSPILKELAALIPQGIFVNEPTISPTKPSSASSYGMPGEMQATQASLMTTEGKDMDVTVHTGSQVSSQQIEQAKYNMRIKASVFADYEKAAGFVEQFRRALEQSSYFKNIKVKPLELEKISPLQISLEKVSLTQVKSREFSLEAELVFGQ